MKSGTVGVQQIKAALDTHGYDTQVRAPLGVRPWGEKYNIDLVATSVEKEARIYISSMWQQTSGTAEHKIPLEILSLVCTLGLAHPMTRGFLVLGGTGWNENQLRFYCSGGLNPHLTADASNVTVCTLNDFTQRLNANRGRL